jgi:nucleobase transporter 1/2
MSLNQVLPKWMEGHREFINTGSDVADQILFVLLSTSMFVAGIIGFVLDNTIPGEIIVFKSTYLPYCQNL